MARVVREAEIVRYHVVGFWRRALAAAIDGFVLLPGYALFGLLLGAVAGRRIPRLREVGIDYLVEMLLGHDPLVLGGFFLCLVIGTLYVSLFTAARGQTLGKHLLGLKVITTAGDRPNLWRALARTGALVAGALFFGVGLLWVGFDREKRGLHDWLVGTYVVFVR